MRYRTTATGEVANQDVHLPGIMPKIPGRFYYFFGKPIETEGTFSSFGMTNYCIMELLHVCSIVWVYETGDSETKSLPFHLIIILSRPNART